MGGRSGFHITIVTDTSATTNERLSPDHTIFDALGGTFLSIRNLILELEMFGVKTSTIIINSQGWPHNANELFLDVEKTTNGTSFLFDLLKESRIVVIALKNPSVQRCMDLDWFQEFMRRTTSKQKIIFVGGRTVLDSLISKGIWNNEYTFLNRPGVARITQPAREMIFSLLHKQSAV